MEPARDRPPPPPATGPVRAPERTAEPAERNLAIRVPQTGGAIAVLVAIVVLAVVLRAPLQAGDGAVIPWLVGAGLIVASIPFWRRPVFTLEPEHLVVDPRSLRQEGDWKVVLDGVRPAPGGIPVRVRYARIADFHFEEKDLVLHTHHGHLYRVPLHGMGHRQRDLVTRLLRRRIQDAGRGGPADTDRGDDAGDYELAPERTADVGSRFPGEA